MKLYIKHLEKPSPMKNALSLYHSDIAIRMRQGKLISQQERSRDRAAPACSSKSSDGKDKDGRSWTSKGFCSTGSNCSNNTIFPPRKGMAKDKDHAVLLPEETPQTLQVFKLKRTGRSPRGEDGGTLVFTTRLELVVKVKTVIIDIRRTAGSSNLTWAKEVRLVHLFTLTIKSDLEASERKAEETFHKKARPLKSPTLRRRSAEI